MAGGDIDGTVPVRAPAVPRAGGPLEIAVLDGPDRGLRRRIGSETTRIGSGEGADVVLADRTVSRVHLEVCLDPDGRGVLVVDPGSKNGTFYLGQRLGRAVVAPGATLRLGETTIAIQPAAGAGSERLSADTRYGALLGESLVMRRLFSVLQSMEEVELPLLVEGETGTGKEIVAREVHAHSRRAKGPFVVLDCAAAQPTLFESALFGHRRGAFTDAVADRAGAAVAADGGTLFLDEIGELPLAVQPKLLRFLERREVTPLGSETVRSVDVRIVAATNRDVEAEVSAGTFRADLFHRLAVLRVRMPALRERPDDIPLLAIEMTAQLRASEAPSAPESLPSALVEQLKRYPWPGNVRELRNVVARALSLGAEEANPAMAGPADAVDPEGLRPYHEARQTVVDAFELHYLERLLSESDGNLSEAARRAGLHRNYVARLAAKHGVEKK